MLPRPFLKWVGGKGQLLPELIARVKQAAPFGRYHEPFIGGGALFFELQRLDLLGEKHAHLSDNNADLIAAYKGVRDDVDAVIERLKRHKTNHDEGHFYAVRAHVPADPIDRTARIIYLNRTCYNGLYRVNSKGEFNVPFGRYKNPAICDEPVLRAASRALKRVRLEVAHFEDSAKRAEPGDLVYFDPPYDPVSKTASFTSYAKGGFTGDSQRLLAKTVDELTDRGVKVLLSNSYTDLIRDLYKHHTIEKVMAARNVNSRGDGRGKVAEVLVRNFD